MDRINCKGDSTTTNRANDDIQIAIFNQKDVNAIMSDLSAADICRSLVVLVEEGGDVSSCIEDDSVC